MKKSTLISRVNPLILKGVAHRGLWNEKVSENSLEAFRLAIKNNVAIELDIHLTKDNDLVVIHDEKLERLTGKEGIVEDLTTKELQENYKLLDGQTIPRFEEVLELVNEQVPILVELKVFRKNYKPLAAKAEEVLSKYVKDKKNFVLISFDPRSLWPFKGKGYIRLLLVAKSDEYTFTLFRRTVEGVDVEKVLFEEKDTLEAIKSISIKILCDLLSHRRKKDEINKLLRYIFEYSYYFKNIEKEEDIQEILNIIRMILANFFDDVVDFFKIGIFAARSVS